MKKLLLIPLVLLALLTITGCERYSWRQKLTITVETMAGEVSGASVTQVSWRKHWIRTDGMGWDYDLTGEAVVVEVTPGRYLFALLLGAGTTEYMGSVAAASISGRESRVIDGALFDEVRDKRDRSAGMIAVPAYQYPMLVTFGDITDPESVKLVDPDDLDATFGCDRETAASRFPWREAGVTYGKWAQSEVTRLSREMASERSGLTGPAGDALTETYVITDDHSYTEADKVHLKELRQHFTEKQQRQWNEARRALIEELPAALPSLQKMTAQFGGPCYKLKAVTLEVTREPVTEGAVEGVLSWISHAEFIVPPEKQPRLIKDQLAEQMLMPSDFVDWKTLSAKRGAN